MLMITGPVHPQTAVLPILTEIFRAHAPIWRIRAVSEPYGIASCVRIAAQPRLSLRMGATWGIPIQAMQPHHERVPRLSEATVLADRIADHIPRLRTDRLVLRAPRIADFSVYAEIAQSPKGRFILDDQRRDHAWYDFVNMTACWLLRGHGLWTVDRVDDNEVTGFVLVGFEPGDHEPELGYMTSAAFEGHGYATEAAGRALRFAFETLGFVTLVSTTDHDNVDSVRVAKKLGGERDPDAERAHGDGVLVFRYGTGRS